MCCTQLHTDFRDAWVVDTRLCSKKSLSEYPRCAQLLLLLSNGGYVENVIEQMLEEDAIRFDTFLKENDKKAHEAIKKAERETKVKYYRLVSIPQHR